MARIAFGWELGGEYGHAMACTWLARALQARGHTIAFVFRELHQLAALPEIAAFDIFQAPRSAREGQATALPASYADILLGSGYADARELTALLVAWRSLLEQWKPDLLVADFAPTALAAARSLDLARVTFGNGFFVPPPLSPLPAFRYDEPVSAARIAAADARALSAVNAAFAAVGKPPLARLADLFEVREHFLCTFPELDHYQHRPTAGYWGPRFRFDRGLDIEWPDGQGKRIFVYVKRTMPQLDALIDYLASSPHRVIAFIPDLDEPRSARLASRRRKVVDRPARLDRLIRHCDLLVCHGGEIGTGALLYGVPQVLFPAHYEQYLTARRLEQVGSAVWLATHALAPRDLAAAIERALHDPRHAAAARAFAKRYTAFSPEEQRRRIIARIEQILAEGGGALPPPGAAPILSRSSTGQGASG